ncbi:MAG: glycosyltransferase family 2 protein, partial [Marinifilaceae bacterium]
MEILIVVVQILELILFTLLAISAGYFLLFSILGLFYSDKKGKHNPKRSIAIFLPAYKEDAVILDVVHSALEQDYPSDRFQVIVIADSFRNSTLKALKKLPIKLIEVHFKKSTKAKALNKAIQNTQKSYDIAVVLDADNIMQKNYLQEVNKHFVPNAIIQTHRTAKNQNTPFAILDAISEEINNHVFRKGQRTIGLSAALIGSGMVFDYPLLKNLMTNITAIGGFDKELEVAILKRRYT